jgi:hypothetical protein
MIGRCGQTAVTVKQLNRAGLRTVRTLHCQLSELGEQLLKASWANKWDPFEILKINSQLTLTGLVIN